MQVSFDTLVKVNFSHSYFSDGKLTVLDIRVPDATRKLLDNHGLLLKAVAGGFYLLYDQQAGGKVRNREDVLKEQLLLSFNLSLKDPLFHNYTAGIRAPLQQSLYYFSNTGNAPGLLHAEAVVTEKDVRTPEQLKERFFVVPFARLELLLDANASAEYAIRFNARSTYWRYVLMSGYLQELHYPAVLPVEGGDRTFGKSSKISLPDNREVSSFASSVPLVMSQRPGKKFQLVEYYDETASAYRVVIGALPSPDVAAVSRLADHRSLEFSDIFIY